MKILLVLPASDKYRITAKRPQIPKRAMLRFSLLPLTTVAALTPAGHEVAICDENVQALDFDTDADVVGISFMTALAPRAYQIAAEFRRRGKITVAGGYHPTLMPDEAAPHFDAVVVGDAEELWPQVVDDIAKHRLAQCYRHRAFPGIENPLPVRRDLMHKWAAHYATINAIHAGRGCFHACRYCSVTAFHRQTYRHRKVDNIVQEIRTFGRDFIFVDDNIIAEPTFARQLFAQLIPLNKTWVAQSSIKIADDPKLLKMAYQAGCRGLFIGIETTSRTNLAAVDKAFNTRIDYRRRLRRIRRQGIGIIAGIIVGLDGDEQAVFETRLRFLQKHRIDAVQLNILTPLPGTPLFREFERAGRILDHDWQQYDFRHVVIQPARMSPRELQDGADWLYSQFYRLDRILWRTVDTLLTTGPVPAALTLKLNLTYRYDNKREGIVGRNPAPKREAGLMARLHEWFGTAKPQTAGYRIDATERRALNRMGPYNIHLQRRAG